MELVMWTCSETTGGVQLRQLRRHWRNEETLVGLGFRSITSAFCVESGLPTRL